MKIGVEGSRQGFKYPQVAVVLDQVRAQFHTASNPLTLVSGGARGVDSFAEDWAGTNGFPADIIYPDWSRGYGAGLERNSLIVERSDLLIAFWDGESRGTLDTVCKTLRAGKPLWLVGTDGVIERSGGD